MSNLNFKWGSHEHLPKSLPAADIGTLFFTKDEGGLYLGVEQGKSPRRIQGVVQYYKDLSDFKTNVLPPYSEDVIYYIADENALVKWNGESIGTDGTISSGKFVVLNVTAAAFNSLSSDVDDIKLSIGNDTTEGTILYRIGDLEESVTEIEEFLGLSGSLEEGQKTLIQRVEYLEQNIVTQDEFSTFKSGYDDFKLDTTNRVATIENTLYGEKDAETGTRDGGLVADVRALKDEVGNSTTGLANTYAIATDAQSRVAQVEIDLDELESSINDDLEDLRDNLTDEIISKVNAVNALTYKGGVNGDTWAALVSVEGEDEIVGIAVSPASIGDTYVATENFVALTFNGKINLSGSIRAGDLIIATAKSGASEGDDGVLAETDINWVHVKTGYDQSLENVIHIDGNTFKVQDFMETTLGSLSIVSSSNNITLDWTSTDAKNGTVTASLVWDSFDPVQA